MLTRGVLNISINNRPLYNEKNAYNKRPFCILSQAKTLGFNIKVDLQYVGKIRNRTCDGDQKELPKNKK